MTWPADTLADFKAWLGGTPDDAAATRALTVALAAVETWLDRELELLERVQEDGGLAGGVLLRAWPVETLTSITIDGVTEPLALDHVKLDKRTGRIDLPTCVGSIVTTVYTAGFATMPPDLEFALWQIAAALYPAMLSAASASSGAPVVRVSTPDVGTVEFARPSSASGASSDRLLGATLSPSIESLLQRYRAESVVGGA